MMVTITSIKLRSPWKFFALSYNAMKIIRQLESTNFLQKKARGIWTMHYTITSWKSEEDLKTFAKSGAHLQAMKVSADLAEEIRTLTYQTDTFPSWKEAKELLSERGKVLRF
ncbi:MAG: DUF3291 domain-containing protein [Cyclobacteriaceae bacterium]|nr:DUF3291 domain-containing protein [Cyclobacteriaceae bacterium]